VAGADDSAYGVGCVDCSVRTGRDFAHAIIESIGNVEIASRIERDTFRRVELRRDGRSAVAGRAWRVAAESAIARDRGNHSGGVDLADFVVVSIGNVNIAREV